MNVLFLCFHLVISFSSISDDAFKIVKDTEKEKTSLDINGNGVDDYFREYRKDGSLRSVRYDHNEDGKIDYSIKIKPGGFKQEELVDRNYDGKIDYKILCSSNSCQFLEDSNFDGHFNIKKETSPQRFVQKDEANIELLILKRIKELLNKR